MKGFGTRLLRHLVMVGLLLGPPLTAQQGAAPARLRLGFENDGDLQALTLHTDEKQPSTLALVTEHASQGARSLKITVSPKGAELRLIQPPSDLIGVYGLRFDLYLDAPRAIGITGYIRGQQPNPAKRAPSLPYRRLLRPGANRITVRRLRDSALDPAHIDRVVLLQLPGLDRPYDAYLDNVHFLTPPRQATEIIKGPYIQNLSPTGVTILWETDAPSTGSARLTTEEPASTLSRDLEEPGTIHEAAFTGLTPATDYSYQVRSGDLTSPLLRFHTPEAEPSGVRFVVYGDTRTRPLEHWRVAEAILRARPQFVLHTGDLVSWGGTYDNWEGEFFQPAAGLLASTPLFPALGNHEGDAHWYYDLFALPSAGESWYSFRRGPAFFLALDSEKPYGPESEQYRWLRKELASEACRSARWRFAYWHRPAYSSSSHGGSANIRKQVVPLLLEAGFDIVFAGHDHAYERSYADGLYHVTAGGGGAPLYRRRPADEEGRPSNPASQVFLSTTHFALVEIEGGKLTLTAFTPQGETIDTLTIEKD